MSPVLVEARSDVTKTSQEVARLIRRRKPRPLSRAYVLVIWVAGALFGIGLLLFAFSLTDDSRGAFARYGFGFLWHAAWLATPDHETYGAGVFIVGTLVVTAVGLVLAVPIGLLAAIFLSELAPRWLATPLSAMVDLLAAVPSIVVGLWGLVVLDPVFAHHVEPFLQQVPVVNALFRGFPYGSGILLAGTVLGVMILPTMVALSRTSLHAVGTPGREAAVALGATQWQVVSKGVLPGARSGVVAAVTLSLGRAVGEALAVAMTIGNRPTIPHSLLAPGATLASQIINQFDGASGLQLSAVFGLGVVLLVITVLINGGGQLILRSQKRSRAA